MKVGASQLYSYRRSLHPYFLSGRPNRIVGTTCWVTSSLISLRLNSTPNLNYKLKKSSLATYVVARKPSDGMNSESSMVDLHLRDPFSPPIKPRGRAISFIYEPPSVDAVTPWGLASICGQRQEMEDAVVTVPQLLKMPVIGDYVANYCRDHMHSALAEELGVIMANLNDTSSKDIREEEWKRGFTKCFLMVDDEVWEKAGLGPHVAPVIVGLAAVVAIVCPSYIVVANCGYTRAVLKRDGESIPLSEDHKATREEEYRRTKAVGGKVTEPDISHHDYGVLAKWDDDHFSRATR